MLLSDVRQFLEFSGVPTVYEGQLPDPPEYAPQQAVALFEYSGEAPLWVQPQLSFDLTTNPGSAKYERPRLQIEARGDKEDYVSGETLVWQVYRMISQVVNTVLASGTMYQRIAPLQTPFFMKWDGNRRPVFAFNCQVFKGQG